MNLDRSRTQRVQIFSLFSVTKTLLPGFLLSCLLLSGCFGPEPAALFLTPAGPKKVLLEVADTDRERSRGLMFRTRLGKDRGMLFVFDEPGQPGFWMKNTYLELDILFLSADGTIVDLFEELSPCPMDPCPSYAPRAPARYALEVAGGFVAHHAVRRGDRIRLENLPGGPSR